MIQLKLAKPSEYTDNTVGLFIKEQIDNWSDVILECKRIKALVTLENQEYVLNFYKEGKHLQRVKVDCYKRIGPVFMSEMREYHRTLKVYSNFPWGEVTITIIDEAEDYI